MSLRGPVPTPTPEARSAEFNVLSNVAKPHPSSPTKMNGMVARLCKGRSKIDLNMQ